MKNVMQKMMVFVCASVLMTSSAKAAGSLDVFKEIGDISELMHGAIESLGKTVVTPAFGLNHWRQTYFGEYSSKAFSIVSIVERSPMTSSFVYRVVNRRDGSPTTTSTAPFIVTPARRGVNSCYPSPGFKYITAWDFSMVVWVDRVVSSGMFPPGPPFHGHLSTLGTQFSMTCAPLAPAPVPSVKYAPFDLPLYGPVVVRFQDLPYEYAWPFRAGCF